MARVGSGVQSQLGQRQYADSDNLYVCHEYQWRESSHSLRLKLYIHDYLLKNNFPAAAAQFNAEAGLGDQAVPINVREGVLHE